MKIFQFLVLIFFLSTYCYSKTFRISHVVSDNSPKELAISFFKKHLEFNSKGKIKIEIYPNGVLFDDREALDALKKGIIQFAAPSFSKIADYVPEFQIYDIPYLFKSMVQIHRSYISDVSSYLKQKALEKGFVVLAFWDNGFKVITTRDKPVLKPLDLKGLKIRTQGSFVINKTLELVGAKPVVKPFNVVIDLLKAGIIDGQQNTFSNIYTQGFYKYQNYMTLSRLGFLGYAFITSDKLWDSLNSEEKKLIMNALEEATAFEYRIAEEKNKDNFIRIKIHSNMKIIKMDSKMLRLWEDYFKNYYHVFYPVVEKKLIDEVLKLE